MTDQKSIFPKQYRTFTYQIQKTCNYTKQVLWKCFSQCDNDNNEHILPHIHKVVSEGPGEMNKLRIFFFFQIKPILKSLYLTVHQ